MTAMMAPEITENDENESWIFLDFQNNDVWAIAYEDNSGRPHDYDGSLMKLAESFANASIGAVGSWAISSVRLFTYGTEIRENSIIGNWLNNNNLENIKVVGCVSWAESGGPGPDKHAVEVWKKQEADRNMRAFWLKCRIVTLSNDGESEPHGTFDGVCDLMNKYGVQPEI